MADDVEIAQELEKVRQLKTKVQKKLKLPLTRLGVREMTRGPSSTPCTSQELHKHGVPFISILKFTDEFKTRVIQEKKSKRCRSQLQW